MLGLTLNLASLSGIKVLEICQEESELESLEKELRMREKAANGIHLSNISQLKISPTNSQKKLKSLHDLFPFL